MTTVADLISELRGYDPSWQVCVLSPKVETEDGDVMCAHELENFDIRVMKEKKFKVVLRPAYD